MGGNNGNNGDNCDNGVCSKHDATMERLFNELNDIKTKVSLSNQLLEGLQAFKGDMHSIIYGNGKEGLLSKTSKVLSQLHLQWGLIILLIGAIIGYAVKFLGK